MSRNTRGALGPDRLMLNSHLFYCSFFSQIEEKINEGTDEFSELKQEIHRLQGKENKYKAERLEANNAVTKMEKSIQECQGKTPQWEKEVNIISTHSKIAFYCTTFRFRIQCTSHSVFFSFNFIFT